MNCFDCGKPQIVRRENHPYVESGLAGVILVALEVRHCPACSTREVVIPNMEGLHRVLAGVLVRKPARLSGPEVRFLRKSRGWSQADVAKKMGVHPTAVSKWENDAEALGPQSDRLLRMLVVISEPIRDYSVHELESIGDGAAPQTMRAHSDCGEWTVEAAA